MIQAPRFFISSLKLQFQAVKSDFAWSRFDLAFPFILTQIPS